MSKTATPDEVKTLLGEGYVYVDVRTEAEFASGHPEGALNVPVSFKGVPNPEFVPVLERALGKEAKIVLGCQSGPRSRRAAGVLEAAGFSDIVEMPAGVAGGRDEFGRPLAGWVACGLPMETGAPTGTSYADVKTRTR
jgi:rhodanese-related sulfurtransferase